MPTVNLNKKEFEKLVGKKLPLDKLKDRISMMGTDLEDIKSNEIIVEVFPDRPDMLSEQGFARAFSSFIGVKKGLREYKVKKSGYKVIVDKSLPKEWPYAFACIVKGIKFDEEKIRQVIQIQEKLGVSMLRKRKKGGLGLYPLEKIKFPVKFVGRDPNKIKFRPLEYPNVITGKQILSKHPKGREYSHICEDWSKLPVFVDSKGTFMSMPPIINSHDVGKIDKTTKDVFIEVTGTDSEVLKYALNIMVTSLADMGGKIYSIECIQQNNKKENIPNLTPNKMKININYVNKILGLNLKESDIKKYLERMGYSYRNKTVLVPAYRYDIMHAVDLIEDIAIAYGYENFKEEIPNVSTLGSEDEFEKFKRKVKDILIGFGYLECNNYNLISEEILNKMEVKLDNIKVLNPVNVEYDTLRSWVIPSLMKVLFENKHHEYPQKIFEVGKVFGKKEFERVGLLSCHGNANFTEAKQILDYLFNALGLKYKLEDVEHGSFIKGRVGRVYCNNKKVGFIGEISPVVLENFSLDVPVVGFEINLSELF